MEGDGLMDGDGLVGAAVGEDILVGEAVGELVGVAVGEDVGALVGEAVGKLVSEKCW